MTFESLGPITKSKPFVVSGEDKLGRTVFYIKYDRVKPAKYPTREYVRYLMFMMEEIQRQNKNPYLAEQLVVIDFDNIGFSNVSVDLLRAIVPVLQACYSGLLHRQMLINTSFIVTTTWKVVKLFVRQEIS